MRLGLLTAAFPTLSLDEIADWASANGFETLEVACWPAGEGAARRYAGVSHIDVETLENSQRSSGSVHDSRYSQVYSSKSAT